jgi:hypothetical protein
MFPGITTISAWNVAFSTGLTMQSIFRAESGGTVSLQYPYVTFNSTPVATVSGRKAYVVNDGKISTGKAGNPDSLLEWDYIPASTAYLNNNNTLRLTGSSGAIIGVRAFASPISIPNGVLAGDGVNVQQLTDLVSSTSFGTSNWIKIGGVLVKTKIDSYGDGTQGQYSSFTFPTTGGTYTGTPWVGFTQNGGDQTASFVIDYSNALGFGIKFRTGNPSGGAISWISIGPTTP